MDRDAVLFVEEQRFRQLWLWALLLGALASPIGVFGYGMLQQLVLGEPWGDRPMSDAALATFGAVTIVLCLATLVGFAAARLRTEVRREGLRVGFRPFHERRIEIADIIACQARAYRPIREYGGWGIKGSRRNRAYNVSGSQGVQLELRSGQRVLIGSLRAEELERAIRRAAGSDLR